MLSEYVAANKIVGLEYRGAGEKSDGSVADIELGELVELDEQVAAPLVACGALVPYEAHVAEVEKTDGDKPEGEKTE